MNTANTTTSQISIISRQLGIKKSSSGMNVSAFALGLALGIEAAGVMHHIARNGDVTLATSKADYLRMGKTWHQVNTGKVVGPVEAAALHVLHTAKTSETTKIAINEAEMPQIEAAFEAAKKRHAR